MSLSQEDWDYLLSIGEDPNNYAYQPSAPPAQKFRKEVGGVETFLTGLGLSALPTAAGTAAAAGVLASPLTGGMSLLAAIGAGMAAGAVTSAAQGAVLPDSIKERYAEGAEQNPIAAFAGEVAPSLAFFRPSATGLRNLGKGLRSVTTSKLTQLPPEQTAALFESGLGAGIGVVTSAASDLLRGEDINFKRALAEGAVNALANTPTPWARKMGFPQSAADSMEDIPKGKLQPDVRNFTHAATGESVDAILARQGIAGPPKVYPATGDVVPGTSRLTPRDIINPNDTDPNTIAGMIRASDIDYTSLPKTGKIKKPKAGKKTPAAEPAKKPVYLGPLADSEYPVPYAASLPLSDTPGLGLYNLALAKEELLAIPMKDRASANLDPMSTLAKLKDVDTKVKYLESILGQRGKKFTNGVDQTDLHPMIGFDEAIGDINGDISRQATQDFIDKSAELGLNPIPLLDELHTALIRNPPAGTKQGDVYVASRDRYTQYYYKARAKAARDFNDTIMGLGVMREEDQMALLNVMENYRAKQTNKRIAELVEASLKQAREHIKKTRESSNKAKTDGVLQELVRRLQGGEDPNVPVDPSLAMVPREAANNELVDAIRKIAARQGDEATEWPETATVDIITKRIIERVRAKLDPTQQKGNRTTAGIDDDVDDILDELYGPAKPKKPRAPKKKSPEKEASDKKVAEKIDKTVEFTGKMWDDERAALARQTYDQLAIAQKAADDVKIPKEMTDEFSEVIRRRSRATREYNEARKELELIKKDAAELSETLKGEKGFEGNEFADDSPNPFFEETLATMNKAKAEMDAAQARFDELEVKRLELIAQRDERMELVNSLAKRLEDITKGTRKVDPKEALLNEKAWVLYGAKPDDEGYYTLLVSMTGRAKNVVGKGEGTGLRMTMGAEKGMDALVEKFPDVVDYANGDTLVVKTKDKAQLEAIVEEALLEGDFRGRLFYQEGGDPHGDIPENSFNPFKLSAVEQDLLGRHSISARLVPKVEQTMPDGSVVQRPAAIDTTYRAAFLSRMLRNAKSVVHEVVHQVISDKLRDPRVRGHMARTLREYGWDGTDEARRFAEEALVEAVTEKILKRQTLTEELKDIVAGLGARLGYTTKEGMVVDLARAVTDDIPYSKKGNLNPVGTAFSGGTRFAEGNPMEEIRQTYQQKLAASLKDSLDNRPKHNKTESFGGDPNTPSNHEVIQSALSAREDMTSSLVNLTWPAINAERQIDFFTALKTYFLDTRRGGDYDYAHMHRNLLKAYAEGDGRRVSMYVREFLNEAAAQLTNPKKPGQDVDPVAHYDALDTLKEFVQDFYGRGVIDHVVDTAFDNGVPGLRGLSKNEAELLRRLRTERESAQEIAADTTQPPEVRAEAERTAAEIAGLEAFAKENPNSVKFQESGDGTVPENAPNKFWKKALTYLQGARHTFMSTNARVRAVGGPLYNYIGKKFDDFHFVKRQYMGEFVEDILNRLKSHHYTQQEEDNVLLFRHLRMYKDGVDHTLPKNVTELTPREKQLNEILDQYYYDVHREAFHLERWVRDYHYDAKTGKTTMVWRRRRSTENYDPGIINHRVVEILLDDPLSAEAQRLKDELAQFWINRGFKSMQGERTVRDTATGETKTIREEVTPEGMVDILVNALGHERFGATLNVEFGPLSRAMGYGLPWSWKAHKFNEIVTRYGTKTAKDLAHWRTIVADPAARSMLDIDPPYRDGQREIDPITEKPIEIPQRLLDNITQFAGQTFVDKNGKSHVAMNKFVKLGREYIDQQSFKDTDLLIDSWNRGVISGFLGPLSGIRDIISTAVQSVPYLGARDIPVVLKAYQDFKDAWTMSFKTGVNKKRIIEMEQSQLSGGIVSENLRIFQMITDGLALAQGRTHMEQFSRALSFAMGRLVAQANFNRAMAGDVKAKNWLIKFGQNIDGLMLKGHRHANGIDYYIGQHPGNIPKEVMNEIAAQFTERVQGTYDPRDNPHWATRGKLSAFFALSRWSLGRYNVIEEDVFKPMLNKDFAPFLKYTIGALGGGVAVQAVTEFFNQKAANAPTMGEAMAGIDTAEKVASVINVLQLAGYAGVLFDLIKDASKVVVGDYYSGFTFPLEEWVVARTENVWQASRAIDQGEDPIEVMLGFAREYLIGTIQMARVGYNLSLGKEDAQRREMNRDLRTFYRVMDIPEKLGSVQIRPNPFLTSIDEFKKEEDLAKAVQALPDLVRKKVVEANGDMERFKQSLAGLKNIPTTFMPSPESNPKLFADFINWYGDVHGNPQAMQRLSDFHRHKALSQLKKSLVPTF